ncbi:MAG: FtsB family cell division protein [Hyphomicrobiaceae bacterium]
MSRKPNVHGSRRSLGSKRWFLVCLCLAAYFGHHTIQGRHGLEARSRLISRASTLASEIRALEAVRSRLERDVALLSESNPDADLIEDLARDMFAFARPNERIIIVGRNPRAAPLR